MLLRHVGSCVGPCGLTAAILLVAKASAAGGVVLWLGVAGVALSLTLIAFGWVKALQQTVAAGLAVIDPSARR